MDIAMSFPSATRPPNYYFLPVIDGVVSREQLFTRFNNGEFVRVPTMFSSDTNEGDVFVPNVTTQAEADTFIVDNIQKRTASDLAEIDAACPPTPRDCYVDYFGQVSATYGNAICACPGFLVSRAVSKHIGELKSWSYLYNFVDPGGGVDIGVTHTVGYQYIFGQS